MQETWQDEDGSNNLLYCAILHSTAAVILITGLHKMVTKKRKNMGSQTCTCIATFCKLIATAMVLSQEGL